MRNVNWLGSNFSERLWKKFYINYEECKCNGEIMDKEDKVSFILTMRNVNKNEL